MFLHIPKVTEGLCPQCLPLPHPPYLQSSLQRWNYPIGQGFSGAVVVVVALVVILKQHCGPLEFRGRTEELIPPPPLVDATEDRACVSSSPLKSNWLPGLDPIKAPKPEPGQSS